jgi:endonuclease G
MKILLSTLFLLPFTLLAQLKDSVYVKTPIFEMVYSEILEQPKWVKYTVLCPQGKASRAGMDFFTNDTIKTSDNEDYAKNVYDKGHMAPAADFNCTKDMLKQTFSYLNCALQNQYLNRGVWRILEEYERQLALKETIIVTIYLVFDEKSAKLETGATVPSGFYKYIYLEKSKKVIKYYFPNTAPVKPKFTDYQISDK